MNIVLPLISIALAQVAGLVGSIFTSPAIPTWYAGLAKPAFTPPGWLFGPVWFILYTFMGIAAYRIWRERDLEPAAVPALWLYLIHLLLNTLWSVLFFGLKDVGLALVEIMVLFVMVASLVFFFWRIDRIAGWLMLPYLLWVSFAAGLNYFIFQLN
jgi:tryptophan-rich sensory protein